MATERATLDQLTEEYEAAMREAEIFAFLVRDAELQMEQVGVLRTLKDRIRGFKAGARQAEDERAANELFHVQCGLNAMISLLTMWVDLKKANYYSAWDRLIDAEEYISVAMRASEGGPALGKILERLKEVERVIFPGFRVFNSAGLLIRGGECSVCGKWFGVCEHIEGRVYWGCLCRRINAEIVKVDHVAIVGEPRDRRCVMTETTTDDGFYRDCMTWKKGRKLEDGPEGHRITGIIFRYKSIETD